MNTDEFDLPPPPPPPILPDSFRIRRRAARNGVMTSIRFRREPGVPVAAAGQPDPVAGAGEVRAPAVHGPGQHGADIRGAGGLAAAHRR